MACQVLCMDVQLPFVVLVRLRIVAFTTFTAVCVTEFLCFCIRQVLCIYFLCSDFWISTFSAFYSWHHVILFGLYEITHVLDLYRSLLLMVICVYTQYRLLKICLRTHYTLTCVYFTYFTFVWQTSYCLGWCDVIGYYMLQPWSWQQCSLGTSGTVCPGAKYVWKSRNVPKNNCSASNECNGNWMTFIHY